MIPAAIADALSAYRLTRLITEDAILDRPRDAVADVPFLGSVTSCRFCCGVWVGFGVMLARRHLPRAWAPVAEALALSAGAALLARLED